MGKSENDWLYRSDSKQYSTNNKMHQLGNIKCILILYVMCP